MVTAELLLELVEKVDKLREAMQAMQGGPQRALLVLLADHTRVSRRDISAILDALESDDFVRKYFGDGDRE